MQQDLVERLEQRLGRVHARQRLGLEKDHEDVFGHGLNFFHPENWYSAHSIFRGVLKLTGLYSLGYHNTDRIEVRENVVTLEGLPESFDGFTILHLTDLHADISRRAIDRLMKLLPGLRYDICVLTGDFRGQTFGPFEAALAGLARVRAQLHGPVYAVLGNHDTIRMLPGIEEMGIRMLLNESVAIERGGEHIHLAGVDDAHYYRADNLQKAGESIGLGEVAVLLSHTPEIFRQAAHAGFQLMLSGHTHGGQICLPGGIPLSLDSSLPRRMGAGAWSYSGMAGYTSVGVGTSIVPVRLNCRPEITLHRLRCEAPESKA